MNALAGLSRVTIPRVAGSAEAAKAGAERLCKMLMRFPAPVALEAIDIWPQQETGQFFPTEKDLHDLATDLEYAHRASTVNRPPDDTVERWDSPHDRTALYVAGVEEEFGRLYVRSWLIGEVNAQFSKDVVFLTGVGYDRLKRDTLHIAQRTGVGLCECPKVKKLLQTYVEELEQNGRAKPRKGASR